MADKKPGTYAHFYEHPQLQSDGSYKDVILAEIFVMGNNNTSISKPVFMDGEPIDYDGMSLVEKYPKAWAAFKRQEGADLDGEPLRALAGVGPAQIRNLANMGIETVEDLAGLDDSVVLGEPGMLDLRKKAEAYLAALHPEKREAEKREQAEKEQAQNEQISSLQEQIAALQAKLDKPKRGRPRKNDTT